MTDKPEPNMFIDTSGVRLSEDERDTFRGLMEGPIAEMDAAFAVLSEEREAMRMRHVERCREINDAYHLAQLRALATAKGVL